MLPIPQRRVASIPDSLQQRLIAAAGDRYEIEREVGRGGMAVVYCAKDRRLRRRVAIKVLPPELAFRSDVRARFQREAETAAQLSHPHIVPIYEVDEADGLVYIVMAFVDGITLAERIHVAKRLEPAEARRIMAEVADALAYAHARGVVHRDIKPDNVLLDKDGGRALVTDFGIARAAEAETRLTMTGIAVGTPTYMSPEQAMGERDVDGRADLYSLGVVGYQMLAGEPPFIATNTPALLVKHINDVPRPMRERRADIPADLALVIERLLAKKAEDRFQSAGEVRDALGGTSALPAGSYARSPIESLSDPMESGRAMFPQQRALPPVLPLPTPDSPLSRADRHELRRQWREQRERWKAERGGTDRWSDAGWGDSRYAHDPYANDRYPNDRFGVARREDLAHPSLSEDQRRDAALARRIRGFRGHLFSNVAVMGGLFAINAATSPHFWWAFFPAIGMSLGILGHFSNLYANGVRVRDVLFVDPYSPAGRGRVSVGAGGEPRNESAYERRLWRGDDTIGDRVATTQRSAWMSAGLAVAALAAAPVVGPACLIAAIPALAFGLRARRRMKSLERDGVSATFGDFFVRSADEIKRRSVGRAPAGSRVLAEHVAAVVPPDVLVGPHGGILRAALADRATILDTITRMDVHDRALIPDVLPTVGALVERIAALVTSLHRVDVDAPPGSLTDLDTRIAREQAAPSGTERDRRIALLQRQRAALSDLRARREGIANQLESATLSLRNLRLELLKLRSVGLGSGMDEVTSATQEARALARDIGYALEAVGEVRSRE